MRFTHSLKLILHVRYSALRIVWIIDIVYRDLRTATRTLEDEIHKLGQSFLAVVLISHQPSARHVFS
jgi:hypothetical protein